MAIEFGNRLSEAVDLTIKKYYGPLDVVVEFHTKEQYGDIPYVTTLSDDGKTILVSIINSSEYVYVPVIILKAIHDLFTRDENLGRVNWNEIYNDYGRFVSADSKRYVKQRVEILKGGNAYAN